MYLLLLPSVSLQKNLSFSERLIKKIDWLGNLLFIGAISCFTLAITFGGTVYSWSYGGEISLWVITGVLLAAFAASQVFHPLVDVKDKLYATTFLRRPVIVTLQLAVFMASWALLVYLPAGYCRPLGFR